MNIVLRIICVIGAVASLIFFTYALSFYHAFESNRDAFDSYSLTACSIFGAAFLILFNLAVM